jgi:enoyl-CoA hydratase/carnithine racemase
MRELVGSPPEVLDFREIRYTKQDGVATVTIDRPHVYNAYSTRTLQEMIRAFQDAAWDDAVAVVVLTGAGDRAFCTGGDVREYAEKYVAYPRDYWKYMGLFIQAHDLLRNIGKPTIARINGIVAGGGNEFNMACDLAVMAAHAYIRQVGTRVGSVACGGATQWLPILVGDRRAREILYLCEEIPPKQCLEWGLVNRVVPSVRHRATGEWLDPWDWEAHRRALQDPAYVVDLSLLDAAVAEMAEKLKDKFPECLRYTQRQVNFWKDLAWHMTVGHGQEWLALHYACWEPLEGMGAFVEKRSPEYRKLRQEAAEGRWSEFPWGPYTGTCPHCGARWLPARFQFCGACGRPLGPVARDG